MTKATFRFFAGLLLVTLTACAHTVPPPTQPSKPEWLSGGTIPRYPSRLYLTGIGTGPTRRAAEDAARLELARYLKVRVTGSSYDWMKSELVAGKEGFVQKLESTASTATDQALEGTSIVDTWEDRERTNYYALAILDRDRAASVLKERIARLDGHVASLLEGKAQDGPFPGLRDAVRAAMALQKREVYNSELIILSPDGTGIPAKYSYQQAEDRINAVMSKVRIGLDISGDSSGDVKRALAQGLLDSHFQVMPKTEGATIVVKGEVEINRVDENSPWQWYLAILRGDILDAKQGTYLGTVRETSREGAQDSVRARNKVLEGLSEKVATAIRREIIKSVGGESE